MLRDVLLYQPINVLPGPDARPARRLVLLRPADGGLEWTTEPDQVVPMGDPTAECQASGWSAITPVSSYASGVSVSTTRPSGRSRAGRAAWIACDVDQP